VSSDGPDPDVFIISTDCMRCGVCEHMCPVNAIQEAKRQLIILKRVCNGCGDCVPYCPVHAIVPVTEFKDRQALTVAAELRAVLQRPSQPDDPDADNRP
jgi:Fe-S-cluster-containing hydrogenase component 2